MGICKGGKKGDNLHLLENILTDHFVIGCKFQQICKIFYVFQIALKDMAGYHDCTVDFFPPFDKWNNI